MDFFVVSLCVLQQFVFIGIWYGPLMGKVFDLSLRRDKNLKTSPGLAGWPYPFRFVMVMIFLCQVARAFATGWVIDYFQPETWFEAAQLGLLFTIAFQVTSISPEFWMGRPLSLLLVNEGYQVLSSFLTFALYFYLSS
mmetsp:Transcript_5249/g.6686  ORF Transcript_5249/g.6686 Transcript_5249/m.6686 type:complete len:138 (+) Transcript_5249:34-447(+)